MNQDIRLNVNYFDHPKIMKLQQLLGAEGVLAHIRLLCYVGRVCPEGKLEGMDPKDIGVVARYPDEPDVFVANLQKLGLLDNKTDEHGIGIFSIHNWEVHNYRCATVKARSKSARRSQLIRWLRDKKLIRHNDKIPLELDMDQDLFGIARQIEKHNRGSKRFQQDNTKRSTKRNAKRNTPPPPPPPRGGEEEDSPHQKAGESPLSVNEILTFIESINNATSHEEKITGATALNDHILPTLDDDRRQKLMLKLDPIPHWMIFPSRWGQRMH